MTTITDVPTDLFSDLYLRSKAVSSLSFGRIHSGGAPALDGFGYVGLGELALHSDIEREASAQATAELLRTHPTDVRIVRTPEGKRLLVRAFSAPGVVSDAMKVALTYAHRAGV